MKLGEIKLESLMMIYPGEVFNITEDNYEGALGELKGNPNFADYLASMPGIINRCFSFLEQRGVLPTKQVDIVAGQTQATGQTPPLYSRYNLRAVAQDYGAMERVIYEGENAEYCDMCEYRRQSDDVILLPYKKDGKYILVYTPRLPRISVISAEGTEVLSEREDIAALIPYFVKSELLYTEQPEEAKLARSLFIEGLNQLASHRESHQGFVETVYKVG